MSTTDRAIVISPITEASEKFERFALVRRHVLDLTAFGKDMPESARSSLQRRNVDALEPARPLTQQGHHF